MPSNRALGEAFFAAMAAADVAELRSVCAPHAEITLNRTPPFDLDGLIAIVETIHEQRRLVLAEVSRMYDDVFPRAEGLVDHAFLRVLQLLGLLLVVGVIGLLAWRRLGAPRPS